MIAGSSTSSGKGGFEGFRNQGINKACLVMQAQACNQT